MYLLCCSGLAGKHLQEWVPLAPLLQRGSDPGATDRRVGPSEELVSYQEDTES